MDWMLTRLEEDSGEDADSEAEDQDHVINVVDSENVHQQMVGGNV